MFFSIPEDSLVQFGSPTKIALIIRYLFHDVQNLMDVRFCQSTSSSAKLNFLQVNHRATLKMVGDTASTEEDNQDDQAIGWQMKNMNIKK